MVITGGNPIWKAEAVTLDDAKNFTLNFILSLSDMPMHN